MDKATFISLTVEQRVSALANATNEEKQKLSVWLTESIQNETQHLAQQVAAGKKEAQLLAQQVAASKKEIESLTRLSMFKSMSPSHVYESVRKYIPRKQNLLHSALDESKISGWFKDLQNVAELPDPGVFQDENKDLHPKMKLLTEKLLEYMGLSMKLSYHCRPNTLSSPRLIPDGAITGSLFHSPGWTDLLAVLEYKTKSNKKSLPTESVAQAVKYLVEAAQQQRTKGQLYGIYSDYKELEMFKINDCDFVDMETSGLSDLLPDGWKMLKEPTRGVKLLCELLSLLKPAVIDDLLVNGVPCKVHGVLGKNGSVCVCLFEWDRCETVAKVVVSKEAKREIGALKYEMRLIDKIREIQGVESCFLLPRLDLHVPNGFAMRLGVPLDRWWGDKYPAGIGIEQMFEILPLFRQLLEGLQLLHNNGWIHGDVRPGNIVFIDDRFKFIDFLSLRQISDDSSFIEQGHADGFWPENITTSSTPAWDLISLGYTFAFICLKYEASREHFKNFETRREFVTSFETKTEEPASYGCRIVAAVEKMEHVDYNLLFDIMK